MNLCYYCQENPSIEKTVINPHTKEIHPTCLVCEYSFELLKKDEKKYILIKYIRNFVLICAIPVFIKYGFFLFLACLFTAFIIEIIYSGIIGHNSSKRDKLEGLFAKKNNLFSFNFKK